MGSTRPTSEVCCPSIVEVPVDDAEARRLAKAFAALSDPVRLRLFSIVASSGTVCSCDLEGPLGKSQPTISHHTRVLAEAGLIVGEKRGRWTWWRAVDDPLRMIADAVAVPAGRRSPPEPTTT